MLPEHWPYFKTYNSKPNQVFQILKKFSCLSSSQIQQLSGKKTQQNSFLDVNQLVQFG